MCGSVAAIFQKNKITSDKHATSYAINTPHRCYYITTCSLSNVYVLSSIFVCTHIGDWHVRHTKYRQICRKTQNKCGNIWK